MQQVAGEDGRLARGGAVARLAALREPQLSPFVIRGVEVQGHGEPPVRRAEGRVVPVRMEEAAHIRLVVYDLEFLDEADVDVEGVPYLGQNTALDPSSDRRRKVLVDDVMVA